MSAAAHAAMGGLAGLGTALLLAEVLLRTGLAKLQKPSDASAVRGLAVIFLIPVGVLVGLHVYEAKEALWFEGFQPLLQRYASAPRAAENVKPALRGRVIVVTTGQWRITDDHIRRADRAFDISELFYKLEDRMRATTPEEVGTIVFWECDTIAVGRYRDGTAAVRVTCKARVIDTGTGTAVDEKTFEGSDPPDVKTSISGNIGRYYGSVPEEQVMAYLRSLPRIQ